MSDREIIIEKLTAVERQSNDKYPVPLVGGRHRGPDPKVQREIRALSVLKKAADYRKKKGITEQEAKLKPNPLAVQADDAKNAKVVDSGIKQVRTATGEDDPDRMEVINTVQGRYAARQYDEREKAMRKLRKTNKTVGEETEVNEHYTLSMAEPHNTKSLFTTKANSEDEVNQHLHSARVYATQNKKSYYVTVHHHHTGEVFTHKIHPMREQMEPLDEISKQKKDAYVKRASTEHGMANFAKRQTTGDEQKYYARVEKNRKKGISRAMKEENEMSENLDTMIDSMINKQPGEFKGALAAELENRISNAIDDRRIEIAQTMLPPSNDSDD